MLQIDPSRLLAAYQQARRELLSRRCAAGHWRGRLCSSALSTATAVSGLSLAGRWTSDPQRRRACWEAVCAGLSYLRRSQNPDGGFGDTDRSFSNVATTLLVRAAVTLATAKDGEQTETGPRPPDSAEQPSHEQPSGPLPRSEEDEQLLRRTEEYLSSHGGLEAVRQRYGEDRTFVAPILTNAAMAGLVDWSEVPALPFELACLPHSWLPKVGLPVVSYAIPALVAIGQAKFYHSPPQKPLLRLVRRWAVGRSLREVEYMQPASGGFLEAVPLTSFVVMSLAATGRCDHPVARRGVGFLLKLLREDGSWPVDADLATWNTTLAVQALAAATGEAGALGCLDWLLGCQHQRVHPFTRARPGGWGWTDLSGAVPDCDDTPGALLALDILRRSSGTENRHRIDRAAARGLRWLLDLQNRDGGWPTFCRGWGRLPFDRSAPDLTAHALRALSAWSASGLVSPRRVRRAIRAGLQYLAQTQQADGSWLPLWFGNQHHPNEHNPVYGTARVLLALRDLGELGSEPARRGIAWLCENANPDGGWGDGRPPFLQPGTGQSSPGSGQSSVEETALAVQALSALHNEPGCQPPLRAGIEWLIEAVSTGRHLEPNPIGFYFARLWYYDELYPLCFTVAALGEAVGRLLGRAAVGRTCPDADMSVNA